MIARLAMGIEVLQSLKEFNQNNFEIQAQALLDLVEQQGMLPPTIVVLPNSYNRAEGTMGFNANEWEPEETNETK
jgi:hypothetical protein